MKLYFSDEPLPLQLTKSIFLAGPSPRKKAPHGWRHDALTILKELNFDGEVFIPIPKEKFNGGDDKADWNYDNQVKWECDGRNLADILLFWVERDVPNGLPGFTTNIEFGEDLKTHKMVYGRPDKMSHTSYMDKRYSEVHEPMFNNLKDLLTYCVDKLGQGKFREKNTLNIPLYIWKNKSFSLWFKSIEKERKIFDGFCPIHMDENVLIFKAIINGQVNYITLE